MLKKTMFAISIGLTFILMNACSTKKDEGWLLSEIPKIEESISIEGFQILTESFWEAHIAKLQKHQSSLNAVDYNKLSGTGKALFLDIQNRINLELYRLDTLVAQHWDASFYRFTPYLQKAILVEKPEKERFDEIVNMLEQVDTFYASAKANISRAIEQERGKLAVEQHSEDYLFLQNEFPNILNASSISGSQKEKVEQGIENLKHQIKDYIGYVTSLINNLDDLNNTALNVSGKQDLRKYQIKKITGADLAHLETIKKLSPNAIAENALIAERPDYFFTLLELIEINDSKDTLLMNVIVFLAFADSGEKIEESTLSAPLLKIWQAQKEVIKEYSGRYVAQYDNYLSYKAYTSQNANATKGINALVKQFENMPFSMIKKSSTGSKN